MDDELEQLSLRRSEEGKGARGVDNCSCNSHRLIRNAVIGWEGVLVSCRRLKLTRKGITSHTSDS